MSLIATRLQNWRVENPELDRNMTRPCEYGALDFSLNRPTPEIPFCPRNCVNVRLPQSEIRYKFRLSITMATLRLATFVRVLSRTMKTRPHFVPWFGRHIPSALQWCQRCI